MLASTGPSLPKDYRRWVRCVMGIDGAILVPDD